MTHANAPHDLTCPKCHSTTAFQRSASAPPVCVHCAAPLPWLHDGTDATFQQDIQAPVPVLVDFWAPWCGPCLVMGPVLQEVAAELAGQVRIVKVNVDENPQTPAMFGVQAIPTLIMVLNGELVDEVVGAVPKFMLIDRVKHLLNLSR